MPKEKAPKDKTNSIIRKLGSFSASICSSEKQKYASPLKDALVTSLETVAVDTISNLTIAAEAEINKLVPEQPAGTIDLKPINIIAEGSKDLIEHLAAALVAAIVKISNDSKDIIPPESNNGGASSIFNIQLPPATPLPTHTHPHQKPSATAAAPTPFEIPKPREILFPSAAIAASAAASAATQLSKISADTSVLGSTPSQQSMLKELHPLHTLYIENAIKSLQALHSLYSMSSADAAASTAPEILKLDNLTLEQTLATVTIPEPAPATETDQDQQKQVAEQPAPSMSKRDSIRRISMGALF